MIALLNPRMWFYFLGACLIAFVLAFTYRAGKANVRADFDAYKSAQQEARILADKAQRTEEQRRQDAADQEAKNAQIKIAALQADAGAAHDAANRLHAAISAAVSRTRKNPGVATAGQGKPDSDPLDLLSGMLYRHSTELVEVGKYADSLAAAGSACERISDKLQPVAR